MHICPAFAWLTIPIDTIFQSSPPAGNMVWITISLMTGFWIGGSDGFWCKFSAAFPTYMVHVAYLLLALISIECCYAISRPFKYRIYMSFKKLVTQPG